MKVHLALCLAVSIATVAAMHRHQSSAPSFLSFVKEKMRNICLEIRNMKEDLKECCNQKDCMYDGRTYSHGSVFMATDGCNFCRCNQGTVDCITSSSCDQQGGGSAYNYRDQIAQSYCASGAHILDHVSAVRRDCDPTGGTTPSCDQICGDGSQFATSVDAEFGKSFDNYYCDAALWFMMNHPVLAPNPGPGQPDAGKMNLVTISFNTNGCNATDCSVNYCCCRAYVR